MIYILGIFMLVVTVILGVAAEEVSGKSFIANTIFIGMYAGEILLVLCIGLCHVINIGTFLVALPTLISMIVMIVALCLSFIVGAQIVVQNRRIAALESKTTEESIQNQNISKSDVTEEK